MGKNRKGYNWKARTNIKGTVDNSETLKLASKIDLPNITSDFDGSNTLVLPSKKRKFKSQASNEPIGKILSKKKRKLLEKVVERKKKKEERGDLLEKLESVQADAALLDKMVSLSSVQTKGLKRQFAEDDWKCQMETSGVNLEQVIVHNDSDDVDKNNDLKPKKIKLKKPQKPKQIHEDINNPNILGFESSSSEEEEETETESESMENEPEPEKEIEDKENIVTEDEKHSKAEEKIISRDNANNLVKVENISTKEETIEKKTIFVPVIRSPEVVEARSKLPIIDIEHDIVDKIRHNDVVIITGETGSGKTTQVPQFLYEAGYAENDKIIGITEPRRVAAIAMSSRVAKEMNLNNEDCTVSYQIRFDDKTKDSTKIKFMTDGILRREVERDPYLKKYSVIVIDEAHERSVDTDILIGHLSRFVKKRNTKFPNDKLKLIIMSATLNVQDFLPDPSRHVQLFPQLTKNDIINVQTRQFNVQIKFNRKTPSEEEYLNEAFKKVCKIHKTLPNGGILVFVTGQDEVNRLVKKLRQAFPFRNHEPTPTAADEENALDQALKKKKLSKVNLDDYDTNPNDDIEVIVDDDDLNDPILEDVNEGDVGLASSPLWTLPLYSKLDPKEQAKVFESPPNNHRLCVVSTNVAETSLTIPGTKYVVDTGKMKVRLFDKVTGVSTYQVMWTSQAQANQRAGRAGRQGEGYAYRLYSSAVFETFEKHALPDIKSRPVEDVVLLLKDMGKNKILEFPFPSPPEVKQIQAAEQHLVQIGALDNETKKLTPLGRTIAPFPVSPRFGKMLALSHQHGLAQHTITMVAALSMQEVLLETPIGNHEDAYNKHELSEIRSKWVGNGQTLLLGDAMVLLSAVYITEKFGCTKDFCDRHGLRFKAMQEIRKLRRQLTNELTRTANLQIVLDPNSETPGPEQGFLLRQILLAGLPDHVARKIPKEELPEGADKKKFGYAYFTRLMEQPVFLHNMSVLKSQDPPEWVVYQEVYEVQGKMYMRGVTAIEPEWLPDFCPLDCNLSKPLSDREPFYDQEKGQIMTFRTGTFGERGWPLPVIKTIHPLIKERTKYFAKFFLDGSVLPQLKEFSQHLQPAPVAMISTWGSLHKKRTESLFEALYDNEKSEFVNNQEVLIQSLKNNPKFAKELVKQYLNWLNEEYHEDVKQIFKEYM